MAAEMFSGDLTAGNPSSARAVAFVATCPSAYTSHWPSARPSVLSPLQSDRTPLHFVPGQIVRLDHFLFEPQGSNH